MQFEMLYSVQNMHRIKSVNEGHCKTYRDTGSTGPTESHQTMPEPLSWP